MGGEDYEEEPRTEGSSTVSEYTTANYPNGEGGKKLNDKKQPDTWGSAPWGFTMPAFDGSMPMEYQDMVADLIALWVAKLLRNQLRYRYYNGKNVLKDFGISIPPKLLNVETIVGWPQKAVDAMAVRSRFDGFTAASADVQAMLDSLASQSRLGAKYRMAVQSELICSCCFATVGLAENGEPAINLYPADRAAARWDDAKGRIAYGLVLDDFEEGMPTEMRLYTDDACVTMRSSGGGWSWEVERYTMGRPCMEVFAYRPTQQKPFGQSRITRAVMSITDSAVREALRTEISAEFFTSPQKYLLGASDDAFENKTMWEAYIGSIFAIGRDENGDMPQFGQLLQGSMQPHTDYFRSLAARFSGETNVPISTLGVIHDNPSSAQAIYAASEPLIIECEDLNDGARDTLKSLALMAIAAKENVPLDALTDEQRDFTPNFKNPAMPSIVSQADAMIKIASVVPGFAGTDTFFEQIGMAEDVRRKVQNEIRRNQAAAALNAMLEGSNEV